MFVPRLFTVTVGAQRLQVRRSVVRLDAVDVVHVQQPCVFPQVDAAAFADEAMSLPVSLGNEVPVRRIRSIEYARPPRRHLGEVRAVGVEELAPLEPLEYLLPIPRVVRVATRLLLKYNIRIRF